MLLKKKLNKIFNNKINNKFLSHKNNKEIKIMKIKVLHLPLINNKLNKNLKLNLT